MQPHSEKNAQQHENAKLPAANIEGEKQIAQKEAEAEAEIQHVAQTGQCPPEAAQQLKEQPVKKTGKRGQQKLACLQNKRQLHQPKIRLKKPPELPGAS